MSWPNIMSHRITIKWSHNDKILGTGTAFLLIENEQAFLVTNRHNLAGRRSDNNEIICKHGATPDEIEVEFLVSQDPFLWEKSTIRILDDDENPLWFEHPELGRKVDVVALPIPQVLIPGKQVHLWPYDLSNPGIKLRSRPTDPVNIIGYPLGRSAVGSMPIWSRGYIASEPLLDYDDLPCFLIDARTKQGQSGSPVVLFSPSGPMIDENGSQVIIHKDQLNLIGIYSGRIQDELDAGIVWKLHAIEAVVKRGIKPTRQSVKD